MGSDTFFTPVGFTVRSKEAVCRVERLALLVASFNPVGLLAVFSPETFPGSDLGTGENEVFSSAFVSSTGAIGRNGGGSNEAAIGGRGRTCCLKAAEARGWACRGAGERYFTMTKRHPIAAHTMAFEKLGLKKRLMSGCLATSLHFRVKRRSWREVCFQYIFRRKKNKTKAQISH